MKQVKRQGGGVSRDTIKRRVGKKSKKILVPLDGYSSSFRALEYALDYAECYSHKVIGLYVVPDINELTYAPTSKARSLLEKKGANILKKSQQICNPYDVQFSFKVASGNVGKEILKFSKKNKIDEIVIGRSNKRKIERFFLGSVSNYIINFSNLPVTLVK